MQPEYLPPMETESIIRQDGCVQYPYTAMAVFQPGMEPTAQAQQQQQQAPAGMASQPHIASQAQAGPQASNSASSLPGSAASQEGTGGSGHSHVMPRGRAGAGQADVSALKLQCGTQVGRWGCTCSRQGMGPLPMTAA